ncbi:MAG: DUF4159 domain-containing protein [Elusimicrobiota bacterium]|nr:DUF4159 domain-containing protein [Elusimicrobiota bacterium]
MRFGFPAALWALPLAALPIVLHLLSRRAARRVSFPDLTLLRAVDARARPKARLREMLLLAARCVLLAALVFAAAAPARRGDAAASGAGLDLVLLLDASYSMRARDGVATRFDSAREAGRRLLKRLAPGDRVAVGVFDEKLKASPAWGDPRAADAALAAARPGWRGTDAASALAQAAKLLADGPKGRRRAVVVLGDGAEHGLRSGTLPPPAEGAAVLGLRFPPLANAWLSSAGPAPDSSARSPRLEVRLASAGGSAATPLDLWVGERRGGSSSAAVAAGGETRAALALPGAERPTAPDWAGRVAARADSLPDDDVAYFSLSHRPSPRVLVLYSDPSFFRAGRPGWFLRELFGGGRETLAGRDADFLEAARWNEADLAKYGTVLVADADRPAPGLSAGLESFAERGGGVWFLPGARAHAADLAAYPWLPARLGQAREPASGIKAAREGAATAGWDELDLSKVGISRSFPLEPAAGAEVWAVDRAGSPLLIAGSVGRGRAVVWAAPLDAGWSNLGLKPFFVPWARACLALSVAATASDAARRVKVGEPVVRSWSSGEAAPNRITVRGPDGRGTTVEVTGRKAVLPETAIPGLYTFEDGGGDVTIAANLDSSRGESDLTQAVNPPWRSSDVDSLDAEFVDAVYGKDLSIWLLLLAALMLFLEMLLSLPLRQAAAKAAPTANKLTATILTAMCLASFPSRALGQQGDRFIWTQIQHGETWDPYPDSPGHLITWLGEVTSVRISPQRRAISLRDPALFSSPFVYLAGTSAPPPLQDDELRRLRQFVSGGGFLWIEDSGGGPPGSFDRWVRRELARVLPDSDLKPLRPDHVLYRTFFLLRGPAGRVRVHGAAEGVDWGGRVAVLYTRDDVLGAWAKDALGKPLRAAVPGGEAQRELAKRLSLNVIMYSLTGSYKADAVHQAAILDKLKAAP